MPALPGHPRRAVTEPPRPKSRPMWNPQKSEPEPVCDSAPPFRVRTIWLSALALAVFVADLRLPIRSGGGILYLGVVLASLWGPRTRDTWLAASLCTALAVLRIAIPQAAPLWSIATDRGLAILAIWSVAALSVLQKRTTHAQAIALSEAEQALKTNAALKAALVRTESAEAQLRRGQRLLDTVATMARIGGWEIDLATLTPIWSQEVYRIHEVDPSTPLELTNTLEFYAPEARPVVERALREAIEHGISFDHTVPFITATGQRRWLRAIGLAERTNGVTTRLSGAFQDVTDQHEIQLRYARASRSSSEGHWDYDFGTETVWCSATHEELLGLPARDTRIPAEEFRARAHSDDQPRVAAAFRQHLADGAPFDMALRMRRGGDWRWFRIRGAVERDELGRLTSFAGSLVDIHDERLAQEELRRVRGRLERAIHGTQDGLWEWDIASDTMWMSPRYCELLGCGERERTESLAQLSERIHPDDRALMTRITEAHLQEDAPFDAELRMLAREEYRWFRVRGKVERDEVGRPLTLSGSTQDITRRKNAEAARIEAEQRLERAIRGSSDGFFEYDVPGKRMWYSPRMGEMLGYAPDEPLPPLISNLMTPDDRKRVNEAVRLHFEEDVPYDVVYRLPTRSGDIRWFRARGRCERDTEGSPTRFSGSIQDITTQTQAEAALVAAKEAAAMANRAKSEFLANMSHEIRTPMNGVLGMTELLLDTALEPVQRDFAETIRASATSLLGVLNDILDFSKIEAGKLEIEQIEMDLRECVEDVGAMMAVQAAAKNLELIVNVDPTLPDRVRGDPHRLRQILTNLVSNAVKFTQRGEIVVEALSIAQQPGRVLVHFEVRDCGAGMSPEVLSRLFQPFEQADASTTRYYGGTGLGLSIVKRLVELMGGQVSVVSELGKGSTFTFTLPCKLVDGAMSAASRSAPRQERRVLVVDDNETNQRVLCGQLRPAGYAVETAGTADDALQELIASSRAGRRYDLVIADDQLPDCDGGQLAIRVKSLPDLSDTPLIMLTSLDRHGSVQRLEELGFAGYLTKPVRGRELRACVEQVLEIEQSAAAAHLPRLVTRGSLATDASSTRFMGRVLIVEDNVVNQQVTRRFLERLGCEVEVAENGQRAVEFCAKSEYDMILMDVQMPVMDGLEATREIRRHEAGRRRAPIIALTASAMTDELERCINAGMDGLLTKPLEPVRLSEALARHGLGKDGAAIRTLPLMRATQQAIDLARLRVIVGEDREFIGELCQTFLASSGRIVDELRRALDCGDRALLGTLAHKLKGGSGSVCAQRVGDLAAVLERSSATGRTEDLDELVEQIVGALDECAGFIEAQVA